MERHLFLVSEFEADVAAGKLPAVSYLVAPTWRSEHASACPSVGEDFSSQIIKVLQKHPEVYAKTVFILNYDEGLMKAASFIVFCCSSVISINLRRGDNKTGGQFFDHGIAPTPPTADTGISTVSSKEEINTKV